LADATTTPPTLDIRRQAAIQHLMFKAMFELSKDRADFISLLFARPRANTSDSIFAGQAAVSATTFADG